MGLKLIFLVMTRAVSVLRLSRREAWWKSAEGHNWLMQGDDPEYSESQAGEYQRSYDTEGAS